MTMKKSRTKSEKLAWSDYKARGPLRDSSMEWRGASIAREKQENRKPVLTQLKFLHKLASSLRDKVHQNRNTILGSPDITRAQSIVMKIQRQRQRA